MKTWMVVLAMLVACGSKGGTKGGATGSAATVTGTALTHVPKVTVAGAVVANPSKAPPVLIVLDDKVVLYASYAATWDELATKDPMAGAKKTNLSQAHGRLFEGLGLGLKPREIYEAFTPPK